MNQSFCQGTSITIAIHTGKCLNPAVGHSLTPLAGSGDADTEKGAHQHQQWPRSWSPRSEAVRLWVSAGWKTGLSALPPNFLEVWLGADSEENMPPTDSCSTRDFPWKLLFKKFPPSFTDLRVRGQARQESSHRMRNWVCLLDFLSLIYMV